MQTLLCGKVGLYRGQLLSGAASLQPQVWKSLPGYAGRAALVRMCVYPVSPVRGCGFWERGGSLVCGRHCGEVGGRDGACASGRMAADVL